MISVPADQDPFGHALLDFWEGVRRDVLLLEEADGSVRPAMQPESFFTEWPDWPRREQQALEHCVGRVLDLGCGAGRHALHLQATDQDVTGVDLSAGAVAVCKARGVQDARLGDLVSPPTDGPWDSVLMMCGNLGLAGDEAATAKLLATLAALVPEGGILLGDSVDPTVFGMDGSPVRLRLHYGQRVSPWWQLYNIPKSRLVAVTDGTGWQVRELLDEGVSYTVLLVRSA